MKHNKYTVRDLWLIVALVYAILGFSSLKAESDGLKKGLILLNEGNVEEAIVVLKQEVDKNPQAPDAHLALGVGYLQKGETVLARGYLEKATELEPRSVPAFYTLAMLYEKEKRIPEAISEWNRVLSLSEDKDLKDLARKHIRYLER